MIRINWRTAAISLTGTAFIGLAAACGGGGSAATPTVGAIPTSPASGSPAASAAAGAIPAGAPEIDQNSLAFKPATLTVKVGEKVYFKNSESALHTVTINGKTASGNMKKGDIFSWVPPAAGTYKITCDFHPQMNATITVN